MLTAISLRLSDAQLESLIAAVRTNGASIETTSPGHPPAIQLTTGIVPLEPECQSPSQLLVPALDQSHTWLVTQMKARQWPGINQRSNARYQFEQTYDTYVRAYVDLYSFWSRRDALVKLKGKLLDAPRGSIQEQEILLEVEKLLGNKDFLQLAEDLYGAHKGLRSLAAQFLRNI